MEKGLSIMGDKRSITIYVRKKDTVTKFSLKKTLYKLFNS